MGAVGGVILYAIWIGINPLQAENHPEVSDLLLGLLNLAACFYAIRIAHGLPTGSRIRLSLVFFAIGYACSLTGDILWYIFQNVLGGDASYTLADLFYLLFYPALFTAILLLPAANIRSRERIMLALDLGIILVAIGMAMWYFILAPMQIQTSLDLSQLVALSYPLGDMLLFAGVISLIQRRFPRKVHLTLWFLMISILLNAVGDAFYAYFEVNAIPYSISPLNLLYMASTACFIYAIGNQVFFSANLSTQTQSSPLVSVWLVRYAIPYSALLMSFVLLFIAVNQIARITVEVYGLMLGVFSLVILITVRQHLMLVENTQLYLEMEQLAIKDSLTGLYNRHYFNQNFQKELERSNRYAHQLAVLLVDMDDLKYFNDTYGHLVGDQVLQKIASTLADLLRKTDILARFAGDEFIILIPETDITNAQAVRERIKGAVQALRQSEEMLSVSIGVCLSQPNLTAEQMLEQVDQSLYLDKEKKPVRVHRPAPSSMDNPKNIQEVQ